MHIHFVSGVYFQSVHVCRTSYLHPQMLTWNLKMMVSKRNLLFQGVIFRFHVKLWGCNVNLGWWLIGSKRHRKKPCIGRRTLFQMKSMNFQIYRYIRYKYVNWTLSSEGLCDMRRASQRSFIKFHSCSCTSLQHIAHTHTDTDAYYCILLCTRRGHLHKQRHVSGPTIAPASKYSLAYPGNKFTGTSSTNTTEHSRQLSPSKKKDILLINANAIWIN